jgi:Icc-related predicted phosphoesterase
VLLFFTPPTHKGIEASGSDVVAEMIATYRPRLALAYGDPPFQEMIGRSLVVGPGTIRHGHYAVADLQSQEAELKQLSSDRA